MNNLSFLDVNRDQLQNLLEGFVDVLKINICLVDYDGNSILTPRRNPYGWELLSNIKDIKSIFKWSGHYLEYTDEQRLSHYALPLGGKDPAGYILIGPVILNKRPVEQGKYFEEIRLLSNVQLKSILDLTQNFNDFIQGLFKNFPPIIDPFKFMLHTALQICHAQSGSIMLLDAETNELKIKVSHGISSESASSPKNIVNSISAIALEKNEPLILKGKTGNNRIDHLLSRTEIKQSIIFPLSKPRGLTAVINLNQIEVPTSHDKTKEILSELARVISTAVLKTNS